MSNLDDLLRDLVTANRILAHEEVVDAYGHVSVRHPDRPDRFFMSCSRSPELVTADDIIEFDLDCNPVDLRGRAMYTERPIHGGIFRLRPDVQSVVHNHAYDLIPFTVSPKVKLKPLFHTAGAIGTEIPVWEIRDKFGNTDMLVRTMAQGIDLAERLGANQVVLMRGHGCAVSGPTLYDAVHTSIFLKVNARLQAEAMRFGEPIYLTAGETAEIAKATHSPASRAWEYWARRAGVTKR